MNCFLMINGRLFRSDKVPLEGFVKTLFGIPTHTNMRPHKQKALLLGHIKKKHMNNEFLTILKSLCVGSDSPEFTKRLRKMGDLKMKNGFLTSYHQRCFEQAVEKLDKNNNVLMSAVYLLTADFRLWKQSRSYVEKDRICFGAFKPINCTENGYTVYCAAKDVYLGTKHFSLSDLADKNLISPFLFELLCTAMAIKRYGVEVLEKAKRGQK